MKQNKKQKSITPGTPVSKPAPSPSEVYRTEGLKATPPKAPAEPPKPAPQPAQPPKPAVAAMEPIRPQSSRPAIPPQAAPAHTSSQAIQPPRQQAQATTTTNKPNRVVLELVKPEAKSVCVAGSFNGWKPENSPLRPTGNGRWVGDLSVKPGRHEYLFVVDGQWVPDPNAKEAVENPFGGKNSVLIVSE